MTPILFTSPTCAYCPSVKKFLDRLGVKYEIRDITETPEDVKVLYSVSGRTAVPTLWTDKGVVVGLNYREIKKILDLS